MRAGSRPSGFMPPSAKEETLRGMLRSMDREEVLKTHHNAQRLLRPLRVNNPLAEPLSFPDDRLRLRRDHRISGPHPHDGVPAAVSEAH